MHAWPVQDAIARFSELLDACISEWPQVVTRRGAETAVLVPIAEWKRLSSAALRCVGPWCRCRHAVYLLDTNVRDFERFGVPLFNPFGG